MSIKYYFVVLAMLLLIAACKENVQEVTCQNISTFAEDPNSGECIAFNTSCIPEGWSHCEPVIIIEEPGTKLERDLCRVDSDCVCGGIDTITNQCFLGNRDYYNNYVDKSKTCPDFCGGIASNLVIRCLDKTCRQISKQQDQIELCNRTGEKWIECGSGCGPLRVGDELGKPRICPAVCVAQCKCQPSRPFWDDDRGCVAGTESEVSNYCKSDDDCGFGIRIDSCCDCPDAYAIKKISQEASLVEYVQGKDYSGQIIADCSAVTCEACPSFSKSFSKCVGSACQLVTEISAECESDSDCSPNKCCHPDDCVVAGQRPDCEGVACTLSCETVLDCGEASCGCVEGECSVVQNS